MSRENWVKLHVGGLEGQCMNRSLDQWLRVFFLAVSRMGSDGHAHFGPGELGRLLGCDPATGSTDPLDKRNVNRAINRAIKEGFLDQTSGSTCLVPAAHLVSRGRGHSPSSCTRHGRKVRHQTTYSRGAGTSPHDDGVHHDMTTQPRSDQAKRSRPLDSVSLPKSA